MFLTRVQQSLERCNFLSLLSFDFFVDFGQSVLRVQELGVDEIRGFEALADQESLSGLAPRSLRFRALDSVEQLIADVEERVVIFRSENFGDEGTSPSQNLSGQLERMQRQFNLVVSVEIPISTNIRGTIIQYDVSAEMLQLLLNN